jgi:sugar (pentulose or hexulose) kinase
VRGRALSGELLLALDNGTQSVRALVFDLEGNLVASSKVPLVPYVSPQPGWAEQDPEYFWSSLCRATRTLFAESSVRKDALKGVALTTQRGTIFHVDASGQALRPAIVWLDQRRASAVPRLGPVWNGVFRVARLKETIGYVQREAEANWVLENEPAIARGAAKVLLLSGFLTRRLTGRFVDSVGCAVGYLPFDYKRQRWARRGDFRWKAIAVAPEQLPELLPPGVMLGTITRAASDATGLPEGLPLVAAAADKACEVLGSGCLDPSRACLSFGTTATINATHRRYVEPLPLLPAYPSAVPGAYSVEVQVYRGFWMVSWFKKEFGQHEEELAKAKGVAPETLFDELVNAVPPGSMGLLLQPYWSPGLKVPGPEAKGAVIGFGDVHTRAHFYRAILEGLAYALRDGKERIEKKTGTRVTELLVAGGGSQSDAALQITADVFGLPAARPHVFEASGLGAAIDAAVGLGLHPSIETAVKAMTRVARVFEPNPRHAATYAELYERVYQRMYTRLKPLYEEIREITGYPPGSA